MAPIRPASPGVAVAPAGSHLDERTIDDHELLWIMSGTAIVEWSSGDVWTMLPGHVAVFPPARAHAIGWDRRRGTHHGFVHFDVTDRASRRRLADGVWHRPDETDVLDGLCRYLLWLDGVARGRIADVLRFVIMLLVEGPLHGPGRVPVPEAVRRAVEHVRTAWSAAPLRRVPVGELAAAAVVSPSHLSAQFRRIYGQAPASALERIRLWRASGLLAQTSLTIESIGHDCGFADLAHFSHRFAAVHGCAPQTFRQQRRNPSVTLQDAQLRRLAADLDMT
jgi:AraC family transcriptional regulator